MTEMIDKPSFLYADDTKIIGNLIEISSIRTDFLMYSPGSQKKTELTSFWTSLNKLDFKNQTSDTL